MIALLGSIAVLVLAYFIQGRSPWLAGAIAVIPIKIIGVSLMTINGAGRVALHSAVEGMFTWQCVWAVALAVAWFATR